MKLVIDIPKEFEQHFKNDRFSDSLNRLYADAHFLAGLYEKETVVMLIEAFKNAICIVTCEECKHGFDKRYSGGIHYQCCKPYSDLSFHCGDYYCADGIRKG